jgi:hypothetical protein
MFGFFLLALISTPTFISSAKSFFQSLKVYIFKFIPEAANLNILATYVMMFTP